MLDLLKSALKAQTIIAVLAMLLATALRLGEFVTPAEWRDVVNAVLLYFVGGGLLKESAVAIAERRQP